MQYCFVVSLLPIASAALVTVLYFGNLLNTLKVCIKTNVLNFRRGNLSLLRAWLGGILWEASMEDKRDSKCWEFFRNTLLEAQKPFMPFKGEGSRERPPWFNYEFLSLLRARRSAP